MRRFKFKTLFVGFLLTIAAMVSATAMTVNDVKNDDKRVYQIKQEMLDYGIQVHSHHETDEGYMLLGLMSGTKVTIWYYDIKEDTHFDIERGWEILK